MDGSGSHFAADIRTVDDAVRSPSQTPPLLHNANGNESSSGSPGGGRRHGSAGDKDKRSREERLRLIKERQEQEHEKRLAELKAAYEKEMKVRQMKDAERQRRIQEMKLKEAMRRQAVEERRRRLESEDKEKREQILAKYKEYEQRSNSHRDQKKPVYAFGSSTPRTLAYLEHLDNSMRVYNSRLANAGGTEGESSPARGSSNGDKRATSTSSLTRKSLTAGSSPNLSPLRVYHQRTKTTSGGHQRPTKTPLVPSGRWGGSMAASMYGGTAAASVAVNSHRTAAERDPLANVRSMTASYAVGEPAALSRAKNVRAKAPLDSASGKSQSTPRSTRAALPPRKSRQPDVVNRPKQNGVAKRLGSDEGSKGAPLLADTKQKAKGVSSARTPSAPPPSVRRPAADAASKVVAPTASKVNAAKGKPSPTTAAKPPAQQKQPVVKENTPTKVVRKPKSPVSDATPPPTSPVSSVSVSPDAARSVSPLSPVENAPVTTDRLLLEKDQLCEYTAPVVQVSTGEEPFGVEETGEEPPAHESPALSSPPPSSPVPTPTPTPTPLAPSPTPAEPPISPALKMNSSSENVSMSVSTTELVTSVPRPTGQGAGKVLSKEEAAAALAERRRLAREQMEREKELERQREEQRRLAEEEARRREEEEFRRQEVEELRFLEEARRQEEERIRKLMEEEGMRREMEAKQQEEEQRKKVEAEARAREETERAERERKEAEEKFRREEQERLERKKRLDAIRQRTGLAGASSGSTPTPVIRQEILSGATPVAANGGNGHANTSIYFTPDGSDGQSQPIHTSSSSAVLKKITSARVASILNRVKSTPNVSGEDANGSNETIMTSSFSAEKVGQTPGGGESRLTQSYYATPVGQLDKGFNDTTPENTSTARTEYDIDANAVKSQSHYAGILTNEDATPTRTNGETAALISMLGIDSNANEQHRSNTAAGSNLMDFDAAAASHNNNVNGEPRSALCGESASISDSDTSSAVTVIHQTAPSHDFFTNDPFTLPKRDFDDLINENASSTEAKLAYPTTTAASHQERPLLDL